MKGNSEYFLSRLGISFTQDTINSMRWFSEDIPKDRPFVLLWAIQGDAQGGIKLIIAGDYADNHPSPVDIADDIEGLSFYWCTKDPARVELIRKNFCVHYKYGEGPVELISIKEQ